jgi:hypothetical protein
VIIEDVNLKQLRPEVYLLYVNLTWVQKHGVWYLPVKLVSIFGKSLTNIIPPRRIFEPYR